MKKLLIISIVVLCAENLSAQTWAEWFRQKATQKKYLLQQIAALKVYTGYLSKGYSIAKNGVNTIKSIKNGDLLQHTNYFTSLVTVNPKIRRYAKVADIIVLQITIAKQSSNAIKSFRNNRHFTPTEINYLQGVYSKLLSDCAKNLDELLTLITNRNLQMKMMSVLRQLTKYTLTCRISNSLSGHSAIIQQACLYSEVMRKMI